MNVQTTIDLINKEPLAAASSVCGHGGGGPGAIPISAGSTCSFSSVLVGSGPFAAGDGDDLDDHGGDCTTSSSAFPGGIRTQDILPGRGKVDHQGNVMFRKLVAERVTEYKTLQNKGDRPGTLRLVRSVIDQVKNNGGRFLDKNWKNEWVEMSEKESIDKADRALRDASRNVAKRTLGSFSIKTQSTGVGDDDAIGKAATTTTGGSATVEAQQRVPEALISGIGPTHRGTVTTTTATRAPPVLPPLFVSCDVRSGAGIDLHAPPSKMTTTTTAMTTGSGETTTTMATAAEFDEGIFDTSESLFVALRPHPERATSSSTLHHTNTAIKSTTTDNSTTMMAMEPLDYSCGSLFEPQTALEMWGHDHSCNSSSSLSVADLILNGQSLQQGLDEETKTAMEDNNAKQGAKPHHHHLLHTNSSANSSARSRRSSRSSSRGGGMPGIKPDSAMSLDLFSSSCMEHSIVLIGDQHHQQQQQPLPSVHHQHHQSSISLLTKGASASMIDMVDEDMLVDSFNQSLDFVNNTANHHHNHGGSGSSNNHQHHHHYHHQHHNQHHIPPLVARLNHATGNVVHQAPGNNSSPAPGSNSSAAAPSST